MPAKDEVPPRAPAGSTGAPPPQRQGACPMAAAVVPESWRSPAPGRLLMVVAGAVFLGEAVVMIWLPTLGLQHLWQEVLIDALMITVVILPMLDWFMLRPLRRQMAEVKRVDAALRAEVEERTNAETKLERSNAELHALSQMEHSQRQLAEALAKATVALNSGLDLDEVLDRTLEQAHRVVPCRALAVLLLEEKRVKIARHRDRLGLWRPNEGFPLTLFPGLPSLALSNQPYVISDAARDPNWVTPYGLDWVHSLALAPLVEHGRTLGFLVTFSDQLDFFDESMVRFLASFAAYAAVALQRADSYDAELRARQTVETLSAVSQALTQTLELQKVLDLLLVSLHGLIPYDRAWIALLESESQLIVRAFARGGEQGAHLQGEPPPAVALEMSDQQDLQRVLNGKEGALIERRGPLPGWPFTAQDATASSRDTNPSGDTPDVSWLAVPIVAGGRTLGLCSLEKDCAPFYTQDQRHLAEAIAAHAAIAVQNAWLFQQLRAGSERLQALSHRLVQVQESERLYVARELHDDAGQALASMMLGLGQIERDAHDNPHIVAGVQQLRQVANDVQENLHRLAMDLRPAGLDQLGLAAALETLVDKLSRQFLAVVQFKAVDWPDERLDRELEVAIYRIAQEALTNVVRHARATHIDVLLQRRNSHIILTVEDDGVGFAPDATGQGERMGVAGMRERCEMLGGTLVIESSVGAGTTIVAEIPYGTSNSRL